MRGTYTGLEQKNIGFGTRRKAARRMGRYEAKDITWNANACYDELPEWLAIPQRVTDGIADDKERRRAVDDYLEFLTGWKVVGYVLTETKEAEKRA